MEQWGSKSRGSAFASSHRCKFAEVVHQPTAGVPSPVPAQPVVEKIYLRDLA